MFCTSGFQLHFRLRTLYKDWINPESLWLIQILSLSSISLGASSHMEISLTFTWDIPHGNILDFHLEQWTSPMDIQGTFIWDMPPETSFEISTGTSLHFGVNHRRHSFCGHVKWVCSVCHSRLSIFFRRSFSTFSSKTSAWRNTFWDLSTAFFHQY